MGRDHRNLIISLVVLAISLVVVTVVLADYLGPDRATTTVVWRRLRCSYLAEHDDSGPGGYYACTLTLYRPPSSGCPSTGSVTGYFSASACGWSQGCSSAWTCSISGSSSTEGCSDGESGCEGSTQTVNQPPATISGSISCADPGSNGWCRSAASLSLSGSEPLSGYSITALEGTRNGVTFACGGSSCSVDLLEGQNDFTYWALSSWGDSSSMGSASGKVDTQPPTIDGTLTGTTGDNGWYVSDVTVSASAGDDMSGLQSLDSDVDGSGFTTYASEVTLGEGTHTVLLRAVDNAGHVSQVSQSFSVDMTPPGIALSGGGSFCPGCGDRLPLSYDVQDTLSGIAQWQLAAGGVVIASNTAAETGNMDWDGSGLGGGTHTLTLSAWDAAGNQSQAEQVIQLRTPKPKPTATKAALLLPIRTATVTTVQPTPSQLVPRATSKPTVQSTFASVLPTRQVLAVLPVQSLGSAQSAPASTTATPVLWGGAAAALIGSAMYVAMEAQRKRKEEEARQIAEMNRLNAEMRAKEKQEAILIAQRREAAEAAALIGAMEAEQNQSAETAYLEAKVASMEGKEATYLAALAAERKRKEAEAAYQDAKVANMEGKEATYLAALAAERKRKENPNNDQFDLAAKAAAIGAARVQREYEEPKTGKGAGLARVVPYDKQLDDKPPDPWYIKIFKEIVFAISGLYGGYLSTLDPKNSNKTVGSSSLQPQKIITPTLIMTPTKTIEPTPTVIPTPAFMQMRVLADALNLREQPSIFSEPYLRIIPKGEIVLIDPNASPAYNDGFRWLHVTYHDPSINSGAVAASPQFLNPLTNFVRKTNQGDSITYNNAVTGWDGKHIGNDFIPLGNTDSNPPIVASAKGTVTNSGIQIRNGKIDGYGYYVIIEYPSSSLSQPIKALPVYSDGKSLYIIYGHLLEDVSSILPPGSIIEQGEIIGNMGASGNADGVHLHTETRLGNPNLSLNASNGDWYNATKLQPIDPALIFTPNDTWTGYVAQGQWDSQLNCIIGEPYLGNP
jgi:murein DD-endopeptidase MepM/ murein hydrolase activator NlpD